LTAATHDTSSSLGDSGESDNDQCRLISKTTETAIVDKPADEDEYGKHLRFNCPGGLRFSVVV
jgi:hypothetical protein